MCVCMRFQSDIFGCAYVRNVYKHDKWFKCQSLGYFSFFSSSARGLILRVEALLQSSIFYNYKMTWNIIIIIRRSVLLERP